MSNNNFEKAVKTVLLHEGGFSNDPDDSGGATDYGISLRFLKDIGLDINEDGKINLQDIKDLDEDKAKAIYKEYWWDKYKYASINSQYIATKVLDMSVNMGSKQAHTLIQRALNCCGYVLVLDGILGKKSFAAMNEMCLHNREEDLRYEIIDEQKWFYEHIAEQKPKYKKFLKGWLRRASF